jgi:hypothetical protein
VKGEYVSHEYDTNGHLRHPRSSVGDNRACPEACGEFGTKRCCHVQRSVCYARSATSVPHPAVRYRRFGGRDLGAGSTAVRRDGQQKCRSEPLAIGEGLLRSLKLTETRRIAGVPPRNVADRTVAASKVVRNARRILLDSGNADQTESRADHSATRARAFRMLWRRRHSQSD